MTDQVAPLGYDFFADVEGTRSAANTLEAAVRFQTQLNALERLEQVAQRLPSQLQVLHERGVVARVATGQAVSNLAARLRTAGAQARETATRAEAQLQPRVAALWRAIEENDAAIGRDGYAAHGAAIAAAKGEADALRDRVAATEQTILDCFSDLSNQARALERHLQQLAWSADALAEATFALRPAEALVEASAGALHTGTGAAVEGVLFLTDQRLVFEERREPQGRRLLPFGKPRRVAGVRLDEPLTRISGVAVARPLGSVFPGATLNVRFQGGAEALFDLKGREVAWEGLLGESNGFAG